MVCDMYRGVTMGDIAASMATTQEHQLRFVISMLCGLLRAAERRGQLEEVLAGFDEVRTGITRQEMLTWFHQHLKADVAAR